MLVLGAGASAAAQFPAWGDDLKETLFDQVAGLFNTDVFLDEAWLELSPVVDLNDVGASSRRRRAELLNKATIEQICGAASKFRTADTRIREVFRDWFTAHGAWAGNKGPGPPPLLIYELIAHLVKHEVIDHIITFNFDELLDTALENELGADGFRRVFSGNEPLEIHSTPKPTLFKVHGTVSSPETMRFSFLDVSILTREMRAHIERVLLELEHDAPDDPGRRLRLVSLGYSWRDRSFAQWLSSRKAHVDRLTVVRREPRQRRSRTASLVPALLRGLNRGGRRIVEVISTSELAPRGRSKNQPVALDQLCWVVTERIFEAVKDRVAVQPIARHLLLAGLFKPRVRGAARDRLWLRARTEVILHLAKAKGFIHTGMTPTLPRVREYLDRLRQEPPYVFTAEQVLRHLRLGKLMSRSPEPEAWDTYIAKATTRKEFQENLVDELLRPTLPGSTIDVPRYTSGRITPRKERLKTFVKRQVDGILDSSDIEVLMQPSDEVAWAFVKPTPIRSFGRFCEHVADALRQQWTHLLVITESLRWLALPGIEAALKRRGRKGTILAILPSGEGLEHWKLRSSYFEATGAEVGKRAVTLQIPWWDHNRHLILPIRLRGRPVGRQASEIFNGVYFTRRFRGTGIAPISVTESRDKARLLGIFLTYCRRLPAGAAAGDEFRRGVDELVLRLLAERGVRGVLEPNMRSYVETLHRRVPWLADSLQPGDTR